MLVLSRKLQERIIIGQEIEIVVLEIRGNRVQLGIQAPPKIPILRDELQPKAQHVVRHPAAEKNRPLKSHPTRLAPLTSSARYAAKRQKTSPGTRRK